MAFDADTGLTTAVFALAGRLFRVDVGSGALTELPVTGAAFDPRLDPTGQRVGYVAGNALRCTGEGGDRLLASEDDPTVSWGSAEFVAAEEMHRMRGYWWSLDGTRLAACRVDVAPVATWYLSSPTTPWSEPRAMRYPAAGTANATVELVIVGLDGATVPVDWSQGRYEYLCDVTWTSERLTVVAQTHDDARSACSWSIPVRGPLTRLGSSRSIRGWSWCRARRAGTTAGWSRSRISALPVGSWSTASRSGPMAFRSGV